MPNTYAGGSGAVPVAGALNDTMPVAPALGMRTSRTCHAATRSAGGPETTSLVTLSSLATADEPGAMKRGVPVGLLVSRVNRLARAGPDNRTIDPAAKAAHGQRRDFMTRAPGGTTLGSRGDHRSIQRGYRVHQRSLFICCTIQATGLDSGGSRGSLCPPLAPKGFLTTEQLKPPSPPPCPPCSGVSRPYDARPFARDRTVRISFDLTVRIPYNYLIDGLERSRGVGR